MVPVWRSITSVVLREEPPLEPPAITREVPSTAHPVQESLLVRRLGQVDPGLHPEEEVGPAVTVENSSTEVPWTAMKEVGLILVAHGVYMAWGSPGPLVQAREPAARKAEVVEVEELLPPMI